MLRKAVRINSLTELALTKLDVLDTFDEVKVCTEYDAGTAARSTPCCRLAVTDISSVTDARRACRPRRRRSSALVEREVGVPVRIVGTGAERDSYVTWWSMIPRYTLPEMAAVFSDTARFGRYLEIELLATEAHAALGVVPAADADRLPAAGAGRRRGVRRRGRASARRSPTTTSPRSSMSCRQAIGAARRGVDPLRADQQRRRRHRVVLDAARRLPTCCSRRPTSLVATLVALARDPPRHGDDRPHARHPRRADDVRGEGGAVGPAGRPRPHAAARRPRVGRGVQAQRRRRYVQQHRSGGRAPRGRRARAARRCRPHRSSPAIATPSSSTRARRWARRWS